MQEESAKYQQVIEQAFAASAKEVVIENREWLDSPWDGFFTEERKKLEMVLPMTGCDDSMLRRVGQLVSDPPPFDLVKGHARMFKSRAALLEKGMADWALGESMAYGTLLMEGHHVRLSGQDAQRGTFSHRHHVINDPNQDGVRALLINTNIPSYRSTKYLCCYL